ncbi:DUF2179 domain-containing protein [Ornithinibacillus sp. 4-3]|uniref:UPF0316 protein AB4Y30_15590 n=1 Tax=Ornithinibacillus sp. 4-3 TaxID=3231488 RepID=A0AB39HJX2_9BACI
MLSSLLSNVYGMVLIILIINIVYVTFSTMRMILTLKGRRYLAALVSMVEIVVYILGLGLVLDNLDQIQNLIAYAIGFGIGIIVGSIIEEKLALGYITVNVVSANPDLAFTRKLRDKGYGVTSWSSYGMEGDRLSMQILTPRKYELKLYQSIKEIDPKAFIISYEPKQIRGGFVVKQVRAGRLFKNKNKKPEENKPPQSSEPVEHKEALETDDTNQVEQVNKDKEND